eukprot:XP_017174182.1 PREDICTED: uncharacterized protein Gm21064 isoform X2 [Mus musculus]
MALKKLMVISKEGYLLLLDFDDEDDDIKVSEEALAEVKSPGFDKNENISPQAEADEYMGDEVDSMLDKSGVKNPAIGKDENISPQVKGDEDMGDEIDSMLATSGGVCPTSSILQKTRLGSTSVDQARLKSVLSKDAGEKECHSSQMLMCAAEQSVEETSVIL